MVHSRQHFPGNQGIAQLLGSACGRQPLTAEEGQILEWCLTQIALEGSGPIGEMTQNLQTSLIAGCDWHSAVAAAMLHTPRQWGSQLQNALQSFEEMRGEYRESEVAVFQFVDGIIQKNMLQVPPLPGFAPTSAPEDPRTKRLFELADSLDVSGETIELVKVLEDRFPHLMTKHYRVDFTGALAALFCDLGIEGDKIPQLLTVAALVSIDLHHIWIDHLIPLRIASGSVVGCWHARFRQRKAVVLPSTPFRSAASGLSFRIVCVGRVHPNKARRERFSERIDEWFGAVFSGYQKQLLASLLQVMEPVQHHGIGHRLAL